MTITDILRKGKEEPGIPIFTGARLRMRDNGDTKREVAVEGGEIVRALGGIRRGNSEMRAAGLQGREKGEKRHVHSGNL